MGYIRVYEKSLENKGTKKVRSYTAVVRIKGITKTDTFSTKTEAEEWMKATERDIRAKLREGNIPKGGATVSFAIELYRKEELPKLTSGTWKYVLNDVDHFLGKKKLADLTEADIVEAIRAFKHKRVPEMAPSSINKFITMIEGVLWHARKQHRLMNHNPAAEIERESQEGAARERFITDDERRRLIEAARKSRTPWFERVLWVAFFTGFRKHTVRTLLWANINFEKNVINLTKRQQREEGIGKRKNRGRNIPIVPPLRKVLLAQKEDQHKWHLKSPYVFPSPFKFNESWGFDTVWQTVREKAQVHDLHFHDIRHGTASYLSAAKVPLEMITKILGHSNPNITMRYIQHPDEFLASEMERAFEKFEEEIK